MKIVSFITDTRVVDRILRHLQSDACKVRNPFEPRGPPAAARASPRTETRHPTPRSSVALTHPSKIPVCPDLVTRTQPQEFEHPGMPHEPLSTLLTSSTCPEQPTRAMPTPQFRLLPATSQYRNSYQFINIFRAVTRRMRAGIAELPDGEYHFEDVLDDDGMGTTDIPVVVHITVKGEEIHFDFSGSGSQVKGNMNNSYAGLQASVLFALKVLIDPDGPTNHGMLEPVHISAPAGSVVSASFPAATAARAQTCQRIIDVILGALATAVPSRVIAASNGANGVATFSGTGPDGRYYLYMETIGGGAGARSYKDGTDGVQVHVTNTSNLPIEALEKEYPLLIERYELVDQLQPPLPRHHFRWSLDSRRRVS